MVIRYWYHPESDSLWTTEDDEEFFSDGLVEELSEHEYSVLKQLREDPESCEWFLP